MMRPAREKKRRRRVLVVATGSPRPMRVVQRARLWAITWTASQAALAGKRPEGRWLRPTPYLRSRMAFSISAWRRWSASRSRVSPSRSVMKGHQYPPPPQTGGVALAVGDEGLIAVVGEEGKLGAGRGFNPADDEPHRCRVGLTLKVGVAVLLHVGGAVHPIRDGRPVLLGYGLDDTAHALVLADGDGEADTLIAADGDNGHKTGERHGW